MMVPYPRRLARIDSDGLFAAYTYTFGILRINKMKIKTRSKQASKEGKKKLKLHGFCPGKQMWSPPLPAETGGSSLASLAPVLYPHIIQTTAGFDEKDGQHQLGPTAKMQNTKYKIHTAGAAEVDTHAGEFTRPPPADKNHGHGATAVVT